MVPRADRQTKERADHVGDHVEEVELAAVRQEGLKDLGADAEGCRADQQGQVEGAPPVGVEDPVEGYSEEEEGDEVEDLVVYEGVADLEGGEAGVAC